MLPSISGANWAAMMNGTPAESSGIIGNNAAPYFKPLVLTEHNAQPTFFHLLKQARPDAETGVVCEWGDFLNYADTLCLDYFKRIEDPEGHPDAIVEESVKYIKDKKPVLCFIHIDALDHMGHAYGQGSAEYYAELPLVDDRVRRIVEGVKEAGIYDDSILIISSDHGHEGTGHGGHALNEIETPLVIWGKGIQKNHEITETVIQYDLAATVAEVFHLEKPQSWRGVLRVVRCDAFSPWSGRPVFWSPAILPSGYTTSGARGSWSRSALTAPSRISAGRSVRTSPWNRPPTKSK